MILILVVSFNPSFLQHILTKKDKKSSFINSLLIYFSKNKIKNR